MNIKQKIVKRHEDKSKNMKTKQKLKINLINEELFYTYRSLNMHTDHH